MNLSSRRRAIPGLLLFLTVLAVAARPVAAQAPTPTSPRSPIAGFPDGRGPTGPVSLKIVSPKPDEVIPLPSPAEGAGGPAGAEVHVHFDLKNYELFQDPKTKAGQYILIVLDGKLQVAHYLADKGWVFKNVPKGTHTLRALLERPWHESIKEPGAYATVTFHVGEKSASEPAVDPNEPVLTVMRPRGKYKKAEAAKLLFDFFVSGCRVAPEKTPEACQVKFRIGDKPEKELSTWAPVWLDNLPAGRHSFTAALFRDGKLMHGPSTLVQGFFEIESDRPPEQAPAGPLPAGPGGEG